MATANAVHDMRKMMHGYIQYLERHDVNYQVGSGDVPAVRTFFSLSTETGSKMKSWQVVGAFSQDNGVCDFLYLSYGAYLPDFDDCDDATKAVIVQVLGRLLVQRNEKYEVGISKRGTVYVTRDFFVGDDSGFEKLPDGRVITNRLLSILEEIADILVRLIVSFKSAEEQGDPWRSYGTAQKRTAGVRPLERPTPSAPPAPPKPQKPKYATIFGENFEKVKKRFGKDDMALKFLLSYQEEDLLPTLKGFSALIGTTEALTPFLCFADEERDGSPQWEESIEAGFINPNFQREKGLFALGERQADGSFRAELVVTRQGIHYETYEQEKGWLSTKTIAHPHKLQRAALLDIRADFSQQDGKRYAMFGVGEDIIWYTTRITDGTLMDCVKYLFRLAGLKLTYQQVTDRKEIRAIAREHDNKALDKAVKAFRKDDFSKDTLWSLTALCDKGQTTACFYLGSAFLFGKGTEKDASTAVQIFQQAADRKHAESMTVMGCLYAYGRGVPRDLEKAFQLFVDAARKSEPHGMYLLGLCYQYGLGTQADAEKAASWYQKAVKRGHPAVDYAAAMQKHPETRPMQEPEATGEPERTHEPSMVETTHVQEEPQQEEQDGGQQSGEGQTEKQSSPDQHESKKEAAEHAPHHVQPEPQKIKVGPVLLTQETFEHIIDSVQPPLPDSYTYLYYEPAYAKKSIRKASTASFVEKFHEMCANVRKGYGKRYIADGSEILLLHDGTFFASGEKGYVLTTRGIVFSEKPHFIAYNHIKQMRAQERLYVNGVNISGLDSSESATQMKSVLERIRNLCSYASSATPAAPQAAVPAETNPLPAIAPPIRLPLTRASFASILKMVKRSFPRSYVYAPDRPDSKKFEKKCKSAIKKYAKRYADSVDKILLLHDDTRFGSAEEGYLLTGSGIVLPEKPFFIPYGNMTDVVTKKDALYVNHAKIAEKSDDDSPLFEWELLTTIQDIAAKQGEGGPLFPLTHQRFRHILDTMTEPFPTSYVYLVDKPSSEKFNKKCTKAVKAYGAKYVGSLDEIYLLYDDTVLGGGDEGFLLTPKGIVCSRKPHFISYEMIASVVVDDDSLIVNGNKIANLGWKGSSAYARDLIEKIFKC